MSVYSTTTSTASNRSPQKGYTSPRIRAVNRAANALEHNLHYCCATGLLPAVTAALEADADAHKVSGYLPPFSEGYTRSTEPFTGKKSNLGFHRVVPTATEREKHMFSCTPLVFAAAEGHVDVVTFLLEKGADAKQTVLCWGNQHSKAKPASVRVDEIVSSRLFYAENEDMIRRYKEIMVLLRTKGGLESPIQDSVFQPHVVEEWTRQSKLTLLQPASAITSSVIDTLDMNTAASLFVCKKLQDRWYVGYVLETLRHVGPPVVQQGKVSKKEEGGDKEGGGDASSPAGENKEKGEGETGDKEKATEETKDSS